MTYRVKPRGNQWIVTRGGTAVSNHRLKRRAIEAARRKAPSGSKLVIYRADGTIQGHQRVR